MIGKEENSDTLADWEEGIRSGGATPAGDANALRLHSHLQARLDDEPFRAFDTMEQYRQWCEANLPEWLGYGRL